MSQPPKSGLAFIPSTLDDFGLPPSPMRVYVHVNRVAGPKGTCFQKLSTIAETCGLSPETTRAALTLLVKHNLLREHYEPGDHGGKEYSLVWPNEWKPLGKITRGRKNSHGKKSAHPSGKLGTTPGKKSFPHNSEVSPSEVSPIKGGPPVELRDWIKTTLNRAFPAALKAIRDELRIQLRTAPEEDKPGIRLKLAAVDERLFGPRTKTKGVEKIPQVNEGKARPEPTDEELFDGAMFLIDRGTPEQMTAKQVEIVKARDPEALKGMAA